MLQIIQAVLKHPDDPTKLSLVFANKTPDDILLKDRLDELANKHADRFKVGSLVNSIGNGWREGTTVNQNFAESRTSMCFVITVGGGCQVWYTVNR